MKENYRSYPMFAACGLNCGLCPRYHTQGTSRCPGCGGEGFYLKHPSCAIINCCRRHGGIEYCYQCEEYPCRRYQKEQTEDSFITYRSVARDINIAQESGLESYQAILSEKVELLEFLLQHYNDGRRKNFYCLAVNLLDLEDVKDTVARIQADAGPDAGSEKERAAVAIRYFEETAGKRGIILKLKNNK